ncbi:MAG: DNA polymerase III subunit delta' [Hylemonella sp.]
MSGPPPWIARQCQQLLGQRGHAWLLQGPSGLGQYELALTLARAWLCEQPDAQGACGACASCHAIAVRTHADLCVLMPEALMLEREWPLEEKTQEALDKKERKPSRDIRIDAMRAAIEFAQRTSARGRGKVVLIHPAERMNTVTANALLKTLEEPPGQVRFVLASEAAHQLLPTIRSRCQTYTMAWPGRDEALAWLQDQGVPAQEAESLLRAAGGRPEQALRDARQARTAAVWRSLPRALHRGEVGVLADWSAAELIDLQHKLCHDLMAVGVGAAPRFFDAADLPPPPPLKRLADWQRELAQAARTAEHPWNAGLLIEAMVSRARAVLN